MSIGTFDPDELEFLAEDITVTIIPTVKYSVFHMLTGDVGPMEPSIPVEVPLWLAVHMRKRKQCRLQIPEWLTVDALNAQKAQEIAQPTLFQPVPSPHFVEMTQLILENFADDVPECNFVRRISKDILDVRLAKLRSSVDKFMKQGNTMGRMEHITQLELCSLRNLVTCGVDQLDMLRSAGLPKGHGSTFANSSNMSMNMSNSNIGQLT